MLLYIVRRSSVLLKTSLSSLARSSLCFMLSILVGFSAPVARPKSVSLTCPVPSTRKFSGFRSRSRAEEEQADASRSVGTKRMWRLRHGG